MNILSLVALLSFAVYLYLGWYAFRVDTKARLNRLFLLFCLLLGWWAFFYAFVYTAADKEAAWFWFKLSAPGWCLIGGVGLHLVLVLTERKGLLRNRWIYLFLYLPGTAVLLRAWTGTATAEDFIPTSLGWVEVLSVRSFWLWFHTLHYSLCALLGLYFLFAWGRNAPSPLEKRQARLFIGGVALFYTLGTLTNIILPVISRRPVPSMAPLFGMFWAYAVWKAVVRYRFLTVTPALAAEEIILRMSDLLVLTNGEGMITRINPQTEKALGYREEELLHQPIARICREDGLLEEVTLRLQRGRLPVPEKEVDFQTRLGELVPVRISLSPIRDKRSHLLGLMIVAKDLRPILRLRDEMRVRRRAEEALMKAQDDLEERVRKRTEELFQTNEALQRQMAERAEMEQLFRTLFLESPIGSYIAQDGRLQMANPAFERITGYREEELQQIGPFILVHPDDREEVRSNAINMLKGKRHHPYEFRFLAKDGRILWILETVASIQYQGRRATLGSFMDITQRKETEGIIHRMAFQDSLTGLPNRALFADRLSQALALAKRHGRELTLMMIDLDNFKEVNDRFGHHQGDLLLKEMGRRLQQYVRKSDTVARMGGDEFMVLLTDVGPQGDGKKVAEKLLEIIREPLSLENETVQVTASIGLAFFPTDGSDEQTLIQKADRAMYRAKEEGKDRIGIG